MFDILEPEDPRQVGRYRIVARIGAGGMGQVYLGRSPGGRPVALKVVRPELARDGEFRRRFAREVTAARRVNGAFTAGVVDADPEGSPAWLATVYVSGVSLGEAVSGHGPWAAGPVLALGAGLAEALEAIHAAGVVHRDLKPSNVLLASDGPRVIDFGISTASEASALTHTGMTIGTPGFMSPEQLTGGSIGPASDVFALGAVLAYTAAGVGPFGSGTPHALHFRAVYEQPDLGALPPGLREIVAACLAKEPDRRPTVADLLHRMAAPAGAEAAEATLSLTASDWMPDPVNRLVLARTATALPRAPGRIPDPAPPAAPTPTAPDVPAVPPGPTSDAVPAPPAPPGISSSPTAPAGADPATAGPRMDEAPTRTADHPAGGGIGRSEPAHEPADPEPLVHSYPAGTPPPMTRRGALLALTGTALAAGAVVAVWKTSDGGSGSVGSPSAVGSSARRPVRTTPPPHRNPGEQIWAFTSGGEVHTSATVANGMVYFGSNDQSVYAVDAATGKQRWAVPTGNVVYSTPAVANGVLYVGTADNGLWALDAATGKKRWTFHTESLVNSSPALAAGVLYIGCDDERLYAVDAETGKQRWNFRCKKDGMVDEAPVVVNGTVYFGSDDNSLYALDATTGKKRWAFTTGDSVDLRPVVAGGRVYASSDRLYAVDAATGKQHWALTGQKYKIPGAGYRHFGAPTVAGGVVYVGDEIQYVFALDAATGKKRWTFDTGNSVLSAPTVAGGVVYVGSDAKNLYALDAVSGKKRWAFPTDAEVQVSPRVSGGVVYVGSNDYKVYAIQT
ncbi:serine/threonine-protein kinase [Actinacidiphila yanglinensis]|uniref:serine/threonine-protein kinase n=1 Tax=Actinacidiphila yanglinensis TaxID=310779 RepID=UPI0022465B4D|nr:serine/threonine-protein kinase [Actinacidiphila yanglinensis]